MNSSSSSVLLLRNLRFSRILSSTLPSSSSSSPSSLFASPFSTFTRGTVRSSPSSSSFFLRHFSTSVPAPAAQKPNETHGKAQPEDYLLHHPVYTNDQLHSIKFTHTPVQGITESVAYSAVTLLRKSFDLVTGYIDHLPPKDEPAKAGTSELTKDGKGSGRVRIMTEKDWMTRFIFLETVAGVPGFMAAMARHLRSLRTMKRDNGWIHTLLEEAENERMHLLTFLTIRKPSRIMRFLVLGAQGVFVNAFFLTYLLWPKVCHRFVGYLEEEAVRTYTHALEEIDTPGTQLHFWKDKPAPEIAINYWRLRPEATMRDVILAIRADEANHRDVNHTLSTLPPDAPNPF